MKATVTVINITPLRVGATTGILTFVNELGLPGTAKICLADSFSPGEQVEVELYERRREGVDSCETWAKRVAVATPKPSYQQCLLKSAVDLVIHATPPGLGVDLDHIRDVVKALEVAHVSAR